MFASFPRMWVMLVTFCMLSSFTLSFVMQSSFSQRKSGIISTAASANIRTVQQSRRMSSSQLYMVSSPKGDKQTDDSDKVSDIDKAMWFDPRPMAKQVSLPNIFVGSILGAVIAAVTIFAPFFLPEDSFFPAG